MSFLKYKSDHVHPLLKISRGCHLIWSKSPSPLYGWPKLHDLGSPQPHVLSPPALPWFFHFSHTSLLLFLNSPTMFLPQGHCTGCFLEHSLPRKPLYLHPGLLADLSFSAGSSLIPLAKIGALSPTPITFWPLPSYTLHGFSQHLMWWPQGWASQISKCRGQNWPVAPAVMREDYHCCLGLLPPSDWVWQGYWGRPMPGGPLMEPPWQPCQPSLELPCSLRHFYLPSLASSRLSSLLLSFEVRHALLVFMYGCESWPIKKASPEKLMLLNCGAGEDSWESLGQQGDQTSQY